MPALSHTAEHLNCPACEQERCSATSSDSLAELPLAQAAPRWLEDKQIYLRARTVRDYQQYFRALLAFFGGIIVREIHVGNVRAYQKWRMQNGPARLDQKPGQAQKGRPAGAGATRINNEIRLLGQLMADVHLWNPIRERYKPLPEPLEGPGVALTQQQAKNLFRVAGQNKRWEVALWVSIIQSQTAMGPGEVRHLQLGDINLPEERLVVRRGLKNRFRARELDLTPAAVYALRKLLGRAKSKGCSEPGHYLLPRRRHGGGEGAYIPTQPQESWRSAWDGMRKAAGMPKLRPYDLRHSGITWLAGCPSVSPQTVKEIAGWSDLKMLKRYSHQERAAKRAAMHDAMGRLDLFQDQPKPPANLIDEMEVTLKKIQ